MDGNPGLVSLACSRPHKTRRGQIALGERTMAQQRLPQGIIIASYTSELEVLTMPPQPIDTQRQSINSQGEVRCHRAYPSLSFLFPGTDSPSQAGMANYETDGGKPCRAAYIP